MKWRFLLTNKWASTPHRQRVYTSAIINYLARHDLVMTLSWPWSLTSDHENLFSDVHSHNEYLYQVSLKSFHSVKRYRDTQNRRTGTTDGRTDGRTNGKHNVSAVCCWWRHEIISIWPYRYFRLENMVVGSFFFWTRSVEATRAQC